MELEGIGTLVTGASRGLGAALARALGRRGAKVVLVARGLGPLEATVRDLRARGIDAHALVADVRDDAVRIAGAASAMVGDIDLLIHNASTLGPVPLRALAETGEDDFREAFEVNVIAPFRLSRALVGQMIARGRGAVIHVSSDAAVEAYPTWGAYGASKAALDHLARIWAAELAGTGVRLLSIDPGEMDTEMHAAAIPSADRASLASPERVAEQIVSAIAGARELPARVSSTHLAELSR